MLFGLLFSQNLKYFLTIMHLLGDANWTLVVTGAVCFIKDWTRKGFFIQV